MPARQPAETRQLNQRIDGRLPVFCSPGPDLLRQLIEKSTEGHILRTTPRDSEQRFSGLTKLKRWNNASQRVIYAMTSPDGTDLGGLTWFRPAPFPKLHQAELLEAETPHHTLALRLYKGYLNQRLAQPLLAATLHDYLTEPENSQQRGPYNGLWLRTGAENAPALKTYLRLGFEEIASDNGKVTMVLSRSATLKAAEQMGD